MPTYHVDRSRLLESAWHVVDGLRVHSRRSVVPHAPGAPVVVLVHGFGISSSYMVPVAERLARRCVVHAPDLPGHGKSGTPPWALHVAGLADALLAWLDAVGIERPALLANSMGCQVVLHLAARHPARVRRLVLVGPTVDRFRRDYVRQTLRLLAAAPFERLSLHPLIAQDYLRMGPRLLPELRAMMADRPEETARLVRAPSLVVHGEHDALTPGRWVHDLAGRLGSEAVVTVPGWGHALNYSAPDELAGVALPFLERRER